MQWAEHLEFLEQLHARGEDVPALRSRPTLYADLVSIWEAFWTLNPSRQVGFGAIGPLAMSEIKAYIEVFPQTDVAFFVACIRTLDREYVVYRNQDKAPAKK